MPSTRHEDVSSWGSALIRHWVYWLFWGLWLPDCNSNFWFNWYFHISDKIYSYKMSESKDWRCNKTQSTWIKTGTGSTRKKNSSHDACNSPTDRHCHTKKAAFYRKHEWTWKLDEMSRMKSLNLFHKVKIISHEHDLGRNIRINGTGQFADDMAKSRPNSLRWSRSRHRTKKTTRQHSETRKIWLK